MTGTLSQLESSIETIINIFHQYSIRLQHPDTLNKKEFKQLVIKELPNFLKKEKKDDQAISDIMEDLDTDVDGELNFQEFSVLVGKLTEASHEEMHKTAPHKGGHSHGPGFGGGCAGPSPSKDDQSHGHGGHGHSHGNHGHSH
ncbi:protein S100-A9 [Physeter macrocephalus]|uniref:Protein S100-A9 n=1 Tax=Physeter macrocephalus TaxID=9755 RepID=A0A2Y9FL51_PHYMC|nr:protein S100-A9 [Physeter catodon]|eukprot:XP_007124462.1 protein S100-A9 [Physeter catodon]